MTRATTQAPSTPARGKRSRLHHQNKGKKSKHRGHTDRHHHNHSEDASSSQSRPTTSPSNPQTTHSTQSSLTTTSAYGTPCKVGYSKIGAACLPTPSGQASSSAKHPSSLGQPSAQTTRTSDPAPQPTTATAPTPTYRPPSTSTDVHKSPPNHSSQLPSAQSTSGLDNGWIATIAVITALGTLLLLGITILLRKMKRTRTKQAPAEHAPRPSNPEVRILHKGERAVPLPETNNWDAVLPQRRELVPPRPAFPTGQQGQGSRGGLENNTRDSACTMFTPKLGRRDDSLGFVPPVPALPPQGSSAALKRSSSFYGPASSAIRAGNWWRIAEAAYAAGPQDAGTSRGLDTLRRESEVLDQSEVDEYLADGMETTYATRHIITPYTSGCG